MRRRETREDYRLYFIPPLYRDGDQTSSYDQGGGGGKAILLHLHVSFYMYFLGSTVLENWPLASTIQGIKQMRNGC